MIVFGQVKLASGKNLRIDLTLDPGRYLVFRLQSQLFLLVVMKEYGGHVLPRPGTGAGTMALPENLQQLFIRDLGGIIVEPDGLGMIAQIMISGALSCSSRISHPGVHHAFEDPEPGVRTPESPQGKSRGFGFGRGGSINGGYPCCKSCCILHHCSFLGT